jgi:hypothetical protein
MCPTLEDTAKARGIGLCTYPRELAANEAKRLRREVNLSPPCPSTTWKLWVKPSSSSSPADG